MSEFQGDGHFRSPRPLAPLEVRREGRFAVLQAVWGNGQPQSSVTYDVIGRFPQIGTVEVSWGQYGRRVFADRWLITKGACSSGQETKGARPLGQEAVLATVVMGDPDPETALEEPLELRLPLGLSSWRAYALPNVGGWEMVRLHMQLGRGHMTSSKRMYPNMLAELYAGKEGLVAHVLNALNLPQPAV